MNYYENIKTEILNNEITKEVKEYAGTIDSISKNGYDHFMLKEINEESEVVKNILNLYTKNNKIKDIYNIKKYKNIDIVDELETCKKLLEQGLISEDEAKKIKDELLKKYYNI